MAKPDNIVRAQIAAEAMYKISGVMPELDIQADYVRVFYPPQKQAAAKNGWKKVINTDEQSDIRIDIMPELMPGLIDKYGKFALAGIGGIAALYAVTR